MIFGEKHKNQQIYDYFSNFKNTCAINFKKTLHIHISLRFNLKLIEHEIFFKNDFFLKSTKIFNF